MFFKTGGGRGHERERRWQFEERQHVLCAPRRLSDPRDSSRPVRGGRPGWQLQDRVHDQDQWESEEGELMQLTVETKMSTAMEVRQWGRVKIGFCKNGVDCAAAAMLLVSDLVSAACLVTLASNSWLEARP